MMIVFRHLVHVDPQLEGWPVRCGACWPGFFRDGETRTSDERSERVENCESLDSAAASEASRIQREVAARLCAAQLGALAALSLLGRVIDISRLP